MQHFVYPENGYKRTSDYGTLKVDHDPGDDQIRVIIIKGSGGTMIRLPIGAAAMLAGFLLSKQPAIVKGDAMAFSPVPRAFDAIPEPEFTVITHGHEPLMENKSVTGPMVNPDSLDRTVPMRKPDRILTDAQAEELHRIQDAANAVADTSDKGSAKDDQDAGDLHPDQERRLTALREATGILGGRLNHDRILEWAGWILDGNTGKED